VLPGQRILSLLPLWHIYERTVQYHVLSRAASVVYSSVKHFKRDLASQTPHFMCCVPLLLDRLHARVRTTLSKLPSFQRSIAQLLVAFSIAHTKVRTYHLQLPQTIKEASGIFFRWVASIPDDVYSTD
jgi:long-chain acyl-CoA synthetase